MTNTHDFYKDAVLRLEIQRAAEKKAAEERRPRVIARLLTLAGEALGREDLNVTITETGPRNTDLAYATHAVCSGCRETNETFWDTYPWRSLSDVHEDITVVQAAQEAEGQARYWAQSHAEKCRELTVEG